MAFSMNKMFIGVFLFLGFFAFLLGTIPNAFFVNTSGYSGASAQDKEVIEYFDAHGMTVYNYTLRLDNSSEPFLHYGESQKFGFGLPEDQKIEFWWDFYVGGTPKAQFQFVSLQVRHTSPGLFSWWTNYHILEIDEPYYAKSGMLFPNGNGLSKEGLENLWVDEYDASYFECSCDHIDVKIFVFPYMENLTIGQSWDAHYLGIMTSYSVDWEAMKPSAWNLLTNLLLFQNPQIGLEGLGGEIIAYILGLSLWGCIAILAFAIVTSLVPFISGWNQS